MDQGTFHGSYELVTQPGSLLRLERYDGDDPVSIDRFAEALLERIASDP